MVNLKCILHFIGLHRNYSEDAVEADEIMKPISKSVKSMPARPPRKGSLTRIQYDIDNGRNF